MKRRIEITVETRRVLVAAAGRVPVGESWCVACAASTPHVAPGEAARLTGTSTREVFRRIEAGRLHFTETGGGELLICRNSLK